MQGYVMIEITKMPSNVYLDWDVVHCLRIAMMCKLW